ncbi:MAG: hypothetical protein Q9162_002322 [Coniocarpon cinnabarinum]
MPILLKKKKELTLEQQIRKAELKRIQKAKAQETPEPARCCSFGCFEGGGQRYDEDWNTEEGRARQAVVEARMGIGCEKGDEKASEGGAKEDGGKDSEGTAKQESSSLA